MLTAAAAATRFDALRRTEFARLDAERLTYLDYTGSALYGASQIREHQDALLEGVFGNPHSAHIPSLAATDAIDRARAAVLRFFGVDDATHAVCFTANTSAAIKLVAESYPFGADRACVLAADNHNSVNGIREYARRAGARVRYVPLDETLRLRDADAILEDEASKGGGLFSFPAQSNFSGVLHPPALIDRAHALGHDVLLDIAAFAPSHPLSLADCRADFAALSFYKLFGFPTGVGALIARREALARLRRPWFAGGTVMYASVQSDVHRLRAAHEGFEDGTPNFLGLAALPSGFALLARAGMTDLEAHVRRLTRQFLHGLTTLHHHNGVANAVVYGPPDLHDRGGTVAFNLRDPAGRVIPYERVEAQATAARVAIRGGCFCNPGAAEAAFDLDPARTRTCLDALGETFTIDRFAACLDAPVGAVRVSLGLANNAADVERAIEVLRDVAAGGTQG